LQGCNFVVTSWNGIWQLDKRTKHRNSTTQHVYHAFTTFSSIPL
jgi:hypothetical protein